MQQNDLQKKIVNHYNSGGYWQNRLDLVYYAYVDYIVRTIGRDAKSMIDVGTANCPYLEWFDWIDERISFDIVTPYSSKSVAGVQGDFLTHDFGAKKYDLCTCMQVLEHIPDAANFAQKLFKIADKVVITVPFCWPRSAADDHIHDPIDYQKLTDWVGRPANYYQVVSEPFRGKVGQRLIAIYDKDESVSYGRKDFKHRIRRTRYPMP